LWEMNTLLKQKNLSKSILCAAGVAAALATPTARAQDATGAGRSLDIQISHGQIILPNQSERGEATLSNVVSYLRQQDADLNVVLGANLGQIKISDVQLHDVPPDLALQALSLASGNSFLVKDQLSVSQNASLVYLLEENPSVSQTTLPVEAFNMAGYIQHIKQSCPDTNKWDAEIENNFRQLHHFMMQVVGEQDHPDAANPPASYIAPKFEFFKGADLFVVIGTKEEVKTIGKIISALPGQEDHGMPGWNALGHAGETQPGMEQYLRRDNELLEKMQKP
jgi:hypothetical protein